MLCNPIILVDPDGRAPDWKPLGRGRWIAEKGDGAESLAQDAGISRERAYQIMENQGHPTYVDEGDGITKSAVDPGDVVTIPEYKEAYDEMWDTHDMIEIQKEEELDNIQSSIERKEKAIDSIDNLISSKEKKIEIREKDIEQVNKPGGATDRARDGRASASLGMRLANELIFKPEVRKLKKAKNKLSRQKDGSLPNRVG